MGRNALMTAIYENKSRHVDLMSVGGLRAEHILDAKKYSELRRRVMLDGCKWDSQVGDVAALAPFPLVMKRSVWNVLATHAEKLASETAAAEEEISQRPDLLRMLGLPPALLNVMADRMPLTPAAGRVIRFDFHYTTDDWRISEANSDVPGGFSEASHFTGLMAKCFPHLALAGNPAETWCDVLATAAGSGGQVALLSAPPLLEDHQVNTFLAARLRTRGCQTHLAKPEQVRWLNGIAHLETNWYRGPLDLVIRFYQAEWLPKSKASGWQYFFRGGKTLVTNPPLSIISESKRFPLTWEYLSTPLPAWRELLPAVCDPREIDWFDGHHWLLKKAYCNNGEAVCVRELMKPRQWWHTKLCSRLSPGGWVAQRRFESVPVPTPLGPRHACIGVYTVNGVAAGSYARMSEGPVTDFAAMDVALLIEENE
jgi:glutathionylspermidine synthase